MSIVAMPEYKIRCGRCQQQMRPVWTVQVMRCPCCDHVIVIPRASIVNLPDRQQMSTGGSGGGTIAGGNRQCHKIESFYSRVRAKMSGSSSSNYYTNSPSRAGLLDGPSRSMSLQPGYWQKKRAVLCGVTYKKRKYKLKGTINDVRNMRQLLIGRFGFLENNILVLTEEERDQQRFPTKKNIQEALEWLVRDSQPGDSLVFFFSGHGLRLPEHNEGDELDGFDETICPVDFSEEGMILDDEINSRIVRPLKEGVTLHAIVDSCHSGTILDLPNVYDYKLGKWVDNRPPSGAKKGTQGGVAISLSACADAEIAADTSALTGKMMSGAMTYSFVHAINKKPGGLSYGELLRSMHDVIDEANNTNCLNHSPILSRVCNAKLLQEPVLSSSEVFDVYLKKFQL